MIDGFYIFCPRLIYRRKTGIDFRLASLSRVPANHKSKANAKTHHRQCPIIQDNFSSSRYTQAQNLVQILADYPGLGNKTVEGSYFVIQKLGEKYTQVQLYNACPNPFVLPTRKNQPTKDEGVRLAEDIFSTGYLCALTHN